MENFKEIFENYGGDYNSTMPRFMNNESMYLKFLNMLFKDDNLKKLNDAIQSGDLEKAFEAAHTLKGVVANMGLTPMYNAVCVIVEPLRAKRGDADYNAMLSDIEKEYEKTGSGIRRFRDGSGKSDGMQLSGKRRK